MIDKYKKINAEQHESVVGCKGAQDCVNKANEAGELQADYARRTSELLEKARVNGSLSPAEQNELSILQVTTIQLEADRNAAIHNALMSGDSSEAKQLAINSLAQGAATSAAGMAVGIKKGKGSAIPVPVPTKTSNGLIYQSNSKHTLGGLGNRPNVGIEPKNSLSLFESSVSLTVKGKEHKARYAIDSNGDIHRFSPDNTGSFHWSGSTADLKNKLELPNNIRAALKKQEGWKIK